jgi:hypothetical protein
MMDVFAGYKSLRSEKKNRSLPGVKQCIFPLQVRIFQEVLPTNYVLIFTKTCI